MSALARRVHELRTAPIGALQVEDLRLLIGQRVGLDTLVPLALGMLRYRPLLEGDIYPGDLLHALLRVPDAWWVAHPSARALLATALAALEPQDPDYPGEQDDEDAALVARFTQWRRAAPLVRGGSRSDPGERARPRSRRPAAPQQSPAGPNARRRCARMPCRLVPQARSAS